MNCTREQKKTCGMRIHDVRLHEIKERRVPLTVRAVAKKFRHQGTNGGGKHTKGRKRRWIELLRRRNNIKSEDLQTTAI